MLKILTTRMPVAAMVMVTVMEVSILTFYSRCLCSNKGEEVVSVFNCDNTVSC
jgi:hypothetical protein